MLSLTANLNLDCFSRDYSAAHERFLQAHSAVPEPLRLAQWSFTHPLVGPAGEPVACEVSVVSQSPQPRKLLVLISGTHGVEGFAGSAIQVDCLPLLAEATRRNPSLGVVVIHALNPWGFAWLRRADHEGIDLNRNFVDFSKPLPKNDAFDKIQQQLKEAENRNNAHPEALWEACGFDVFAEEFTRGQYQHADGCFYGGSAPSWSRTVLEQVTGEQLFASAERIAVVDLHTGLGPYGYGELINDHAPGTPGDNWVTNWYGDNAKSAQRGESVSTMKVGLMDFHWHRLVGDRGCFVTLEFGTYEMERLGASLLNEQHYQNRIRQEGVARDISNPSVQELRSFFYPEEPSWQQQVLFRGRQIASLACEGLLHD